MNEGIDCVIHTTTNRLAHVTWLVIRQQQIDVTQWNTQPDSSTTLTIHNTGSGINGSLQFENFSRDW